MITLEQCLHHLGIDYADDMVNANVETARKAAELTLKGAVGEDVETLLPDDARVQILALLYMEDYYTSHVLSETVGKQLSAYRAQVMALEWQLKLELRRLREAGA